MKSMRGRRILIVDDEPLVAMMVADMLSELGAIPVGPVFSHKQAQAAIDTHVFDGAILDVNLGDNFSFSTARELTRRGVPCCFATGYGAIAIPDEFSGTAVLEKPYGTTALAECVGGLFEERVSISDSPEAASRLP